MARAAPALSAPEASTRPPFVWKIGAQGRRSCDRNEAPVSVSAGQQGPEPGAHLRVLTVASPRAGSLGFSGSLPGAGRKGVDRGKEATAPLGSRRTWRARKGGRAPEMTGSGYQMHTQGRRPTASATERLRDSSGVTQLGWQPVRATVLTSYPGVLTGLIPAERARTPSLGSDSWGC